MNKRLVISHSNVTGLVMNILRQVHQSDFKPDYVVGITTGGMAPAVMISHYLDVPCETLKVDLRDGKADMCETNLWMAEDAFGSVDLKERAVLKSRWDINKRKNILIIDAINDTGATFNWIKNDWQSGCLPKEESAWESVWRNNVKFAALVNNEASEFDDVSYIGQSINQLENPCRVEFPWENWWSK